MVLIERPSAKEDSFNIEKLRENNLCISISEKELVTIDISEIKENLRENINFEKLNKYENQVTKIVDIILS